MDQELRDKVDSMNSDTTITIVADLKPNGSELIINKVVVSTDNEKAKKTDVENKVPSCVIDIEDDDLSKGNQSVCRICHLSAKESGLVSVSEVTEIGCGCKGELAVAHSHCAEAWFRVRGNRLCEICGVTARNIRGFGNSGFMEEWNDLSRADGSGGITIFDDDDDDESSTCIRKQTLCNIFMACVIVAFVVPWFFRINMFKL